MPLTLYRQALAAIFFIAFSILSIGAETVLPVPTLTARVIDQTQTLSASDLQMLEQQLQQLEEKTGSQVVVLMLPSTAPEDIAAYAHRVASHWKLGRRDIGDGALIVVAKDDRRMRIEVARTLEGVIPDLVAARIIDDAMAPRFRAGDYAGGLRAAIEHMGAHIAGEALPTPPQHDSATRSQGTGTSHWAVLLLLGSSVLGQSARRLFGPRWGAVAMGASAGMLVYWLTVSLLLAGIAAVVVMLINLLSRNQGGGPFIGGGGRGGRGGGGFSSGGSGGGFSSGGGGSFGGGGASGRW